MKIQPLNKLLKTRSNRQTVIDFGEKFGMVYFGRVDQHDDEHEILRGMTVSHQHADDHYSVGSYQSYDVAFVERSDTLGTGKAARRHTWHILQFDLHTSKDLPHVFVGLHSHSDSFYTHLFTKYAHLRPLTLGALGPRSPEFTYNYRVYGPPSQQLTVEALFDASIDSVFVQNFKSLAVELVDGSLYIYSEKINLSAQLLEVMLKNGTWLAGHIDAVSKTLT